MNLRPNPLRHPISTRLHWLTLWAALYCLPMLVNAQPEEVVVTGTAPEKITLHVSALLSVSREDQVARWNLPLCVAAQGLTEQYEQVLRERVSKAAEQVRLSLADKDCNPNIFVFFASTPKDASQQLVDHFEIPLRQAGVERLQGFLDSEAPVRWISTFDPCGFGCRLANSRITASSAPALQRLFMVVDVQRLQNKAFASVADYLAFVMLTNPAPEASPSLRSVLGLFGDDNQTSGLTIYDQAYLESLYSIPMDRHSKQQQHAISSRMMHRLAERQN